MLLLRPNHVVSKDELIDGIWGERPPKAAAAALQNSVFRLREALGHERIEWRSPGYVLHVDASNEIDARQFEHLLAAREGIETAEGEEGMAGGVAHWRR